MHSQAGTDNYLLIYGPLLGNNGFSGMSLQIHNGEWDVAGDKTYDRITEWRDYSADAGRPWVIDQAGASKASDLAADRLAIDAVPLVFQIETAYPNPFTDRFEATFTVDRDQAVRIEVFDILGRQVQVLHEGFLEAGVRHVFGMAGAGLAPGVFIVRAVGESTATQRVIIHAR